MSRIVSKVSALLAAEMLEIIKMPKTEIKQTANRQLFRQIGVASNVNGLSGIDGAIDYTHILTQDFTKLQKFIEIVKDIFCLIYKQLLDHVWNYCSTIRKLI